MAGAKNTTTIFDFSRRLLWEASWAVMSISLWSLDSIPGQDMGTKVVFIEGLLSARISTLWAAGLRASKSFTQGHIAGQWQNVDPNLHISWCLQQPFYSSKAHSARAQAGLVKVFHFLGTRMHFQKPAIYF